MSSIRPLATITVLALVGVFLYAKINETEAPLPEGVEDWAVGTDIDMDMGIDDPASPPTFATNTPAGEAPAYTTAPTFDSGSAAAPTWNPPPAEPNVPSPSVEAPTFQANAAVASVDSAMPEIPDLPPMPSLPPAVTTSPEIAVDEMPNGLSTPAQTQSQTNLPTDVSTEAPMESINAEAQSAAGSSQAQSSLFSATRLAVQAALDRGELSQALLLLSDWYGDPSLSASEAAEVDTLLSQLAGSVIYSTEPRLEPPYIVQAGERLEAIAKQYNVPWQLLAKINGISSADQLQAGQKIKVLRGPFSAVVDMSKKTLTLMLDRRYAGRFKLDFEPSVTIEEGHWQVKQKLLTPANASFSGTGPTTPTDERSLMLASEGGDETQVAVLRGTMSVSPLTEPAGRIMRMKPADAQDVFDILSLGSKVVIRR